ncbi:hypothetical protein DXG01_001525 [Tephrocybe rancida]|nr:hypothetical protein DXG01_001525 [Tephrocybe rancida]
MTPVVELGVTDIVAYSLGAWLVYKILRAASAKWRGVQTTALRGPPSKSFLFGLVRVLRESEDQSVLTEQWANEYGSAFAVPGALGSKRVVIVDPKAVTHFYSKETFGYIQTPLARSFIERLVSFKFDRRLEQSLNPQSLGEAYCGLRARVTEGIAGFSHDFGSLDGKVPAVVRVVESLTTGSSPLSLFVFLLGSAIPLLLRLPTGDNKRWSKLHVEMGQIARDLLDRTRKDRDNLSGETVEDKSIIGLLIKAESANTQLQMSSEEVLAQNVLLLAGYETTSISLTWALIELSRKQEKQQKLREELSQFSAADPTWEQLASELPYLDSIAHEILRLHPPVTDTNRIAAEDDIIPLTTPVVTASGETVPSLVIKKGTAVTAPIRAINRSEAFWGPNAKDFEPERWLEESDIAAKQFQGHRNILTFSDGPRICLGRSFALAEFKAALSVLVRNYTFELLDGPETKIEKHRGILPRPKVAGQDGAKVPLRVRRVE